MRVVVVLIAIFGAFVLVAMTVAPSQPAIRDWYIGNACPYLDQVSQDICAALRRAATGDGKAMMRSSEALNLG